MFETVAETLRLNHTLGAEYGADAQRMAELRTLIEAHLRLGLSLNIEIDRNGVAHIHRGKP